ncbi:hypothetical protein C0J52_08912 [Blattella germanica]|nr:hypothetical protein C0J52_08912 [Blattella germanica]
MVKGSNSVRNKKLHSSKPYDVSNSFVKKVTSHVTNLLPQKTWISKWFTSGNNEIPTRDALNSNDSGSEEEDDDVPVLPPPAKRSKIPLNQQFPPNSFNVSPIINDEVSSHAGPSRRVPDNYVTDNAVAGPSGINTRPRLVSSTPNVQSPATSLLSASERKLNGDDRSESSESTSGCSSLVPQANRQFQTSETATNTLSARRRSIDEKLNFTGHLQNSRSLFSDRSYTRSTRLNSALSRRRPSFSVSTFSSPIQVTVPKRGVQVKPVDCDSDSLSSMSSTARRILEALEQFSSPVLDAKRIPMHPTPPLSSKRKRLSEMGHSTDIRTGLSPSLRIGQSPRTPNSARPLTVPTVPDLLKMKHREKLQDTMEAARLIAASSANNSVPTCVSMSNRGYRLRFDDNEKAGKHGGKIRSKEKELEEETVEEVSLPAIPLPVTSLPKFDFVVPPAVSAPSVLSTFKFASPITVTENARTCKPVGNFTFSKPLSIGNKDMINYSTKKLNCIDTSIPNCPAKPSELQFKSGNDNKFVLSERAENNNVLHKNKSQNSEVFFGIKPAAELKTGSVMDVLGKMSSSVDKEVSSSSNNFLDKFKPAPGMWECSSCMIRNKSDDTKCVCCETPRHTILSTTSSKKASSSEQWECTSCHTSNMLSFAACSKCSGSRAGQTSQVKESLTSQDKSKSIPKETGFGNKFKPPSGTWECSTCLVRNSESSTQCQACETKRPGLAAQTSATLPAKPTSNSGFGDKFKKPEGSWECPACMVCNKSDSLKCIACEGAKPGEETNTSTTKFNFGISAEASGFKFGVDKAGDTSKESAPKAELGFKFGETKVTTASNFSFGVNANVSSTTKTATATTATSAVTTPSFSFGTAAFSSTKTEVKPADTSSFSQSGFTFGVPQVSKLQSPTPSEDKKPKEVPKKRRASETGEVLADSKSVKTKESEKNMSSLLASSSERPVNNKDVEEKSEKKVSFGFGFSSGPTITNEPNTSTKSTDIVSGGLRLDKPANLGFPGSAGAASSTIFGNSTPLTKVSNPITTATTVSSSTAVSTSSSHTTAPATVTSSTSNLFTFGSSKSPVAFGGSASGLSFAQSSATTSAPSSSFGTALKTTNASSPSTFSFNSQIKPFNTNNTESSSKTQAPTFGSITSTAGATALGSCTAAATTTTAVATITTTTVASSISSQSIPAFGAVTSVPSFNLAARNAVPTFGTSNSSTVTSTTNVTTASTTTFGSPNPSFTSIFTTLTDQNKQSSKSIANPAPFTFGSNTNNSTSSLGTTAPFSFGNVQNDQGITSKGTFTFGAPSSNASLGSSTTATPAANSGFGFVASNPAPTFSFGSSASPACNPPAQSLFGSANTSATPAATGGPIFGAAASGTFGSNAPGGSNSSSTTFSAPAFNFNAPSTQPSSGVFGFSGSQASGAATTTPAQNFVASTPNFNFGQTQTSAQTSELLSLLHQDQDASRKQCGDHILDKIRLVKVSC